MDLILAERLQLLLLDDDKGVSYATGGGDAGLAGALLLDLTHREAVDTDPDGDLVAVAGADPGHPLLREAHAAIATSDKRRDVRGWVGRLPRDLKPLRERVSRGLAEHGVLSEERRKVLGLFPSTRFPEADPGPERALRERLRAVLVGEREPGAEDAMLIALLEPYDLVRKLVPRERRKAAKATAKALADGGPAGDAVAASVRDLQVAVMAGVVAATAASAATAGANGGGA